MWKLLSKATIATAASALAVTAMSAPANAAPVDDVRQQTADTMQGTPVPLPRPLPDGDQAGGSQPSDQEQPSDGSTDALQLPEQLLDKLPQRGNVPPELEGEVRKLAGDDLQQLGSVELPNRQLTTGPNGDLVMVDPETIGEGQPRKTAEAPVEAAQENAPAGDAAPSADVGQAVDRLLGGQGPLAGLNGVTGDSGLNNLGQGVN